MGRNPLKKLMMTFLVVAAAVLMSGCVQMHMVSNIEKDGSGTMDLTMSLSKVVTDAIAEMGTDGMDDDLGKIDSMMDMTKKDLEEAIKGHDVKIKEFNSGMVDGRQTTHVVFGFKDLEGMSYAMKELMGKGEGGLAIVDLGDGQYALRAHDYNWPEEAVTDEAADEPEASATPDEMDPEKMQKQMALMGKLMGAMGELEVTMQITVPGDIIKSNAPTVEGRTSSWKIDSSNMMGGNTDMEPDIIFSSKGLKLKPIKE